MTAALAVVPSMKDRVSAAEWRSRVELAAAYRAMAHFGFEDLTYNHISARVAGEPDAMLVKPLHLLFCEVTASSLAKYKLTGEPLANAEKPMGGAHRVIHAHTLLRRPDMNCVLHAHTPATVAVASQEAGLLPLSQHAFMFWGRIAYHEFGGFEFNLDMAEPLARDVGDRQVALLRNHGSFVTAATVGEAFVLHHFLEMACRNQVAALAGGAKLVLPRPEVRDFAARQMIDGRVTENGGKDWPAVLRLLERVAPDYKN